jgi:ABC-type lipoprotein release transport system permease subunit
VKLFHPALDSFFRSRKLILYIIGITFTIGIMISALFIRYSIDVTYRNSLANNIINRKLAASYSDRSGSVYDEALKELASYDYIIDIYPMVSTISAVVDNKYECSIESGCDDELPSVRYGSSLVSDKDSIVMVILPEYLRIKSALIEAKDLLNSTVNISYDGFNIAAEVVGIYYNEMLENKIYISLKDMESFTEYDKDLIEPGRYFIVVDKYSSVKKAMDYLNAHSFSCNVYDTSGLTELKLYETLSKALIASVYFIAFFTFILLSRVISDMLQNEQKDFALLKALGYSTRQLFRVVLIRVSALMAVSYIAAIILSIPINVIITYTAKEKGISLIYNASIHLRCSAIPVFFIALISIISAAINKARLKKIDPIVLLKEN